ncbi:MAG: nitroreductase family protein [Clostridia bacterium]|nr:nitroreductase family protein [Clostridia bacterium]
MRNAKKTVVVVLALILFASCVFPASAEATVDLISSIPTTQVFSDEPVDQADLEKIVQSGLAAASAINQQPWYFAVITNKDVMAEIGSPGMGGRASLGSSPAAIIIYISKETKSPNPDFDCGLCCENMVIAANALGYATKIVTAPTMSLNGDKHDQICETLHVDNSLSAVAVLLIGHADTDATSSASVREAVEAKVSYIQ